MSKLSDAVGELSVEIDEDTKEISIVHPIFGDDIGLTFDADTAFKLGMWLCSASMVVNPEPFKGLPS